jgi:hypothetical protein
MEFFKVIEHSKNYCVILGVECSLNQEKVERGVFLFFWLLLCVSSVLGQFCIQYQKMA